MPLVASTNLSLVAVSLVAILLIVLTAAGYALRRRIDGSVQPLFPLLYVALWLLMLGGGAAANVGAVPAEATSVKTWLVILVGAVGLTAGSLLGGIKLVQLEAPNSHAVAPRSVAGSQAVILLTVLAICVAAVNFKTGQIALLSSSTTAARFAGDYGTLGRAWPIVYGILQAFLVLIYLQRQRVSLRTQDRILVALASLVLVLSASRSFIAICVIACAVDYLERKRPRLSTIVAVMMISILLVGSLGHWRTVNELGSDSVSSSLQRNGLPPGVLGTTLQSLSTGPRVLSRTLNLIPDQLPCSARQVLCRRCAQFHSSFEGRPVGSMGHHKHYGAPGRRCRRTAADGGRWLLDRFWLAWCRFRFGGTALRRDAPQSKEPQPSSQYWCSRNVLLLVCVRDARLVFLYQPQTGSSGDVRSLCDLYLE